MRARPRPAAERASPRGSHAARGFTLIELMVGMVIGMLLLLVVSAIFLSQRLTYRTQSDLDEIQENARSIGQLLQREARQAGFNDVTVLTNFGGAQVVDAANDGGLNASDSLIFRYFGFSAPGAGAGAADGTIVDCAGNVVDNATLRTDTFTIANDAQNQPWLQCNGTPLFPGVEYFQVLVGEDTDGDLAINRYVGPGLATMPNARALLVSVVLRGAGTNHANPVSPTVNHFGTGYAPANVAPANDAGSVVTPPADGRLRKQFTYYIAVRNRLN